MTILAIEDRTLVAVAKKVKPLENGDKVHRADSDLGSVWIILSIDRASGTADIVLRNTELRWFKYPLEKLTRIEN